MDYSEQMATTQDPRPYNREVTDALIPQSERSAVLSEYGNLNSALSVLQETVDTLRLHLQPVCGPGRPRPESGVNAAAKQEALSPLAESLRADGRRVHITIEQLRELIDRIEL